MNIVKLYQRLPFPVKNFIAGINGLKLNYWRKKDRKKIVAELIKRESWTPAEYKEWQNKALRDMLQHARTNVPYYRQYWDNNPAIDFLDLNNWPILEKQTVRNNPQLFIAETHKKKKLFKINTSGTTGKPMTFLFDRDALSLWYAMYQRRLREWNGVNENDRCATIAGQLICPIEQNKPPYWVYNKPMHQIYLSSYHITKDTVKDYIKAITDFGTEYMMGYVSSIYNIAGEGLKQNIKMPKLKLVVTNAEPLLEHQKEVISKAFSCPVLQSYSGCEFAFGGCEDLSGRIYLWPEAGIMEVQDAEGNINKYGKGEFIITGLVSRVMPLIRYRVGDTGEVKPADASGRNVDYVSEVTGRTDDLIVTPEGKLVGRLDPVFKGDFKIKEAQIIQEDITNIKVLVVPDEGYSEYEENEILQRLRDRVGSLAQLRVELTDRIPRGANGKFKAVVSLVKKQSV